MTRIADLLDGDSSEAMEDTLPVSKGHPAKVFMELPGYVATSRIKEEYERLTSAIPEALNSPDERVGIWISGPPGSGKSSLAKNLAYLLAKAIPYQIFPVNLRAELAMETHADHIAEAMDRALMRELDYAEDYDLSRLEIELEKKDKLTMFEDLCQAQYKKEWRDIRRASQKLACASSLLHQLAPQTYHATETWLKAIQVRPAGRPRVQDLVDKAFALCDARRPGSSFAFILDEIGPYATLGAQRIETLRAVVAGFGRESLRQLKAGKIPGPVWIIVTAREQLQEVANHLAASRITRYRLEAHFKHQIALTTDDVREVVARHVLRKKENQKPAVRKLFRDSGASLVQNIALERSSLDTRFDEDLFVRFYPYLPHLIDLTMDILAGIRLHPNRPGPFGKSNLTIVKLTSDMLLSDRARLANQPIGALVSIDKIYSLAEADIPPKKRQEMREICERFDNDEYCPGMAGRAAKAICLLEFVKTDLPRTTKNIAALLIQNVTEEPPTFAVARILRKLEEAQFVRQTEAGWKLYDFDELRRRIASLKDLSEVVGAINPRPPGWCNDMIQAAKKALARLLRWYTKPLYEFNVSVSTSLEEVVRAVDHLTASLVALDRVSVKHAFDYLSVDMVGLEEQLAQLDKPRAPVAAPVQAHVALLHRQVKTLVDIQKTANAMDLAETMETDRSIGDRLESKVCVEKPLGDRRSDRQWQGNDRTTYITGLFGTGRRYINELMLQNIGERAKYFRDGIRLHPGPTPMIYSGHVTTKYLSRAQERPEVMKDILQSVKSGFADWIFVYRHPLDSLLTNWVWWRTYIRDGRAISGITEIYKNTSDLCIDLENHFSEFKSFADGDPEFFAALPGPRFLSFEEFVEETQLQLQSAKLALRLEDFMADPPQEFYKIVKAMSVRIDLDHLSLVPPRTKPYGHLVVMERVPQFNEFVDRLNTATKARIEEIGYRLGG